MSVTAESIKNKPATIGQLLDSDAFRSQLKMALPRHVSADKMLRVFMTELRKTPTLRKCTQASLAGAFIQCAQLGLEPGGVLGHAYLIPYRNSKLGTHECQLIVGYRGMIELARRSGQIVTIQAHVVYERDEFVYEYGLTPKLVHIPSRDEDRGEMLGAYAVANLVGGGVQYEFMSRAAIEKSRASSKSRQGGHSPWDTHPEEMWRKTVVRRLFKYLPVSIEIARAVGIDEASERGEINNYVDIDYEVEEAHEEPEDRTTEVINKINAQKKAGESDAWLNEYDKQTNMENK